MFADLDEASAGEEVATRDFTAAAVVEATGAERGASVEAFLVVDASKPDESGFLAGSGSMIGGMEAVVVTASDPRAAFRLMEPVTDSNPCSSAAIRANSRSRSPFNVSIADESRLISFLAASAISKCDDCFARSVATTWWGRIPALEL